MHYHNTLLVGVRAVKLSTTSPAARPPLVAVETMVYWQQLWMLVHYLPVIHGASLVQLCQESFTERETYKGKGRPLYNVANRKRCYVTYAGQHFNVRPRTFQYGSTVNKTKLVTVYT